MVTFARTMLRVLGARRTPRRRLPRQQRPRGIAADYYKDLKRLAVMPLREVVEQLVEQVKGEPLLSRERADASVPPRVRRLLSALGAKMASTYEGQRRSLETLAERVAHATTRYQRAQLGRQIVAAVGVDLPLADRAVSEMVSGFVQENVALIRRLGSHLLDGVEREVERSFREGDRWEGLRDALVERVGVAESHAALIARDQVGKLYSQVNEARQRELGADRYVWRTANDERVRPEHEEREGETFSWDEPPEDGHPGEPVLCRCFAEPDFSAVLGESE